MSGTGVAALRLAVVLALLHLCTPPLRADFSVRGRFAYEDRAFGLGGFTGLTQARPIRFAEVRIVAGSQILAVGYTGADGEFVVDVPGSPPNALSAVCLAAAAHRPGPLLKVRVAEDDFSFGDVYAVASETVKRPAGAELNLGTTLATAAGDAGKAFNIWDVAVDGLQLVASAEAEGEWPDQELTLIWRETHFRAGSYYQGGAPEYIYVGSGSAFNDTVISHELSHFLIHRYSQSDSPGGIHYLGDNNQDIRLSWDEGLATFLGCAMRMQRGYDRPEIYVSTDGSNLLFSCELESLGGNIRLESTRGSTNETAVAAALWDILDGPQTPDSSPGVDDDPLQCSFGEIWSDLTRYLRHLDTPGITVEDFWDGWFSPAVSNGSLRAMQQIFPGLHGIELMADATEGDDAPDAAPLVAMARPAPRLRGGGILLNEIDMGRFDAVELFNSGRIEVDLGGWVLVASSVGAQTTTTVLPSYRLAPGAFVVFTEAPGYASTKILYVRGNFPWSREVGGSCTLLDNRGTAVDFVRWGDSAAVAPEGTRFVGPNPACLPPDQNLGRDFFSLDTDAGSDWIATEPSLAEGNHGGFEIHHTHYPKQDCDFAAFEAVAGTICNIELMNRGNGGRIYLDIIRRDGEVLQQVEQELDRGGSISLSWLPPTSGRYFLRSGRRSSASSFADYGAYDLRVTTPGILQVEQGGHRPSFSTLTAALAAAQPGDVIEIMDSGVYRENLTITTDRLTIRAASGMHPVLDGTGLMVPAIRVSAAGTRIEAIRIRGGAPGILVASSTATLVNSTVYRAGNNSEAADGIQVTGDGASLRLIHCTITNNGRIGLDVSRGASARLVNSIIAGNGFADLRQAESAAGLVVLNSLIGIPPAEDGAPQPPFLEPSQDDYRLGRNSPGIDAGDPYEPGIPAFDAAGLPRACDGNGDGLERPDLGPYEYVPSAQLRARSVLPQVTTGGRHSTDLIVVNPGDKSVTVGVLRTESPGHLLSEDEATARIAPLGSWRAVLQPRGEGIAGIALIAGSDPVQPLGIIRVRDTTGIQGVASLPAVAAAPTWSLYVDNTAGAYSGYALANLGSHPATADLALRSRAGALIDLRRIVVAAGERIAEFAHQRFPGVMAAGFEGSLEVSADQGLAAAAVRFDNAAQDVFSTIPNSANAAATRLYLPQVADGAGYRTNLLLMNEGSAATTVQCEFFDSMGLPLELPVGAILATSLSLEIAAKGTVSFRTQGSADELRSGWIRITSARPIVASAILQTLKDDSVRAEAEIPAAGLSGRIVSYVQQSEGKRAGVALCNPHPEIAAVTLRLRKSTGELVVASSALLEPFSRRAAFLEEWLRHTPPGLEGTLEITSSVPISGLVLIYDNPSSDVFALIPPQFLSRQ